MKTVTELAQQIADQELNADCKWLFENDYPHKVASVYLRKARRPTPPRLKEQALHELNDVYNRDKIDDSTYDTIRRALEALDD
jgi:DNA replicative helicase MCM subunit Mcm2 (Cdc46/Mcm family)